MLLDVIFISLHFRRLYSFLKFWGSKKRGRITERVCLLTNSVARNLKTHTVDNIWKPSNWSISSNCSYKRSKSCRFYKTGAVLQRQVKVLSYLGYKHLRMITSKSQLVSVYADDNRCSSAMNAGSRCWQVLLFQSCVILRRQGLFLSSSSNFCHFIYFETYYRALLHTLQTIQNQVCDPGWEPHSNHSWEFYICRGGAAVSSAVYMV